MEPISKVIDYVIRETGVSALELPNLVKVAKTTTATDYTSYLVRKLVDIAENELGIPHTQLQAKWATYIIEIENESAKNAQDSVSQEILDYFENWNSDDLVINFDHLGTALPDAFVPYGDNESWQTEPDLDEFNTFFLDNASPEFQEAFNSSEQLTLIADFTLPTKVKSITNSTLGIAFKEEYGVTLRDYQDLTLARALNLLEAHGKQVGVVLVTNTDYWAQPDKKAINHVFLSNFKLDKVNSFYVDARKVRSGNLRDTNVLVTYFTTQGTAETKGIRLENFDGNTPKFFYAKGVAIKTYLEKLVGQPNEKVYTLEADGNVSDSKSQDGYMGALGYYTENGVTSFESLPRQGAKNYPITSESLPTVALLATLGTALESDIRYPYVPLVLDGLPGYDKLVADCLPHLMFGSRSNFKSWGVKRTTEGMEALTNKFSHTDSTVKDLLSPYLSLMSLPAKLFWDFAVEIEEDEGMPFLEYRDKVISGEISDQDFLDDYKRLEKSNLDYITANYSLLLSYI